MKTPIKVVHLISLPAHYYAALYRELSRRPEIDLTVMFYSTASLNAYDACCGRKGCWDVPLTDGYKSYIGSSAKVRTLFNPRANLQPNWDVLREVLRSRCDVVWAFGYTFVNTWVAAAAQFKGYRLLLRDDQTLLTERPRWKRALKHLTLPLLFRYVGGLYTGEENRRFFLHYGTPRRRLFRANHCVDNKALRARRLELEPRRREIRESFGIRDESPVVLFSGKLIDKKKPQLLLEAFEQLRRVLPCHLLFVGDGGLRRSLEDEVSRRGIPDVRWAGFLNQSRIAEAYVAGDIFVLPSAYEETWGLVVNEAMNFALPIVVSDKVGCGPDLVRDGYNGFVFRSGDVEGLRSALAALVASDALRKEYGAHSAALVQEYSVEACADQLVKAFLTVAATPGQRW